MKMRYVYSFGVITPSKLLMLDDVFPSADGYAGVSKSYFMTGGEACNSSIVLNRLGVNVCLDGLWLGSNNNAKETIEFLNKQGIDIRNIQVIDDFENIEELVIADKKTRTIFANYSRLNNGNRLWSKPSIPTIKKASLVCLDPFLGNESKEVASLCIKERVPYVTVDCHYSDFIAINAEVIIISGEYRSGNFNNVDKLELFKKYQNSCKGIVIFTSADDDIIYSDNGIHYFTPYKVDTIDTAGAGDSFRSGIIYGILNNYPIEKSIAFASLLASYICQSFPGVMKSPDLNELKLFSHNMGYDNFKYIDIVK